MAKRRRRFGSKRRRGMGSAVVLRGFGALDEATSFGIASVVGVVVPAATLVAVRYFVDPAKGKTEEMVYRHAPWIGLGAGLISAAAVGLTLGKPVTGVPTAVAALGVAFAGFAQDKLLVAWDKGRVRAALALQPSTSPAAGATSGYYSMRSHGSLGAVVPELTEGTGAIVMSPTDGLGYRPYVGGETINLGSVNSEAFGTPAFRP